MVEAMTDTDDGGRGVDAIDTNAVREIVIDADGEPVIASEVQEEYNDRTGEDRTRRGIYGHLKTLADDDAQPIRRKTFKGRRAVFWYDRDAEADGE